MRISFVCQDLFGCGVQYVTASLIREFVNKGYEVDLIVSKVHCDLLVEGKEKPFEVPESVRWIYLPSRRARWNIAALHRYCRQTDAVAVVVMSSNYHSAIAAARIGAHSQARFYYVEHNGAIGIGLDGRSLQKTPRKYSFRWLGNRFWTSHFDGLLTVGSGTADAMARMLDYPRNRISVVFNPVVDDAFREKSKKSSSHEWLEHKIHPTFIVAGAHTGFKNHLMLFDAIYEVNKIRPVRLILFGCGDLTAEYEKYIHHHKLEDRIALGGYCNNLPAELKQADGFICSSDVESFSIVLVEALACGIQVISTNCPYGPPEILEGGRYGKLVPIGDSKAMAAAILEVVEASKQTIVPPEAWNRFTIEETVKRYESALGLSHE
ncbi:MAG: glycosyltransferase [Kiritimatiellia bacterium]